MQNKEQQQFKRLILKSVLAGVLGFVLMAANSSGAMPTLIQNPTVWLIIGMLSGVVMWFSGRDIFIRTGLAFKDYKLTGDTLIALALGGIWLYSILLVLLPEHIPAVAHYGYFDTAISVIFFINLGKVFELKIREKAPQAINTQSKFEVIFVSSVIIISLVTFVLWFSLGVTLGVNDAMSFAIISAITVLFISSPTVYGLATSITLNTALAKAAQHGVLFSNAEVLQDVNSLDMIVLDKTGTITQGKPDVVAVHTAKNIDVTELLQVAASVESQSPHPLANAIVLNAKHQDISLLDITQFNSVAGMGVSAKIANEIFYVGSDLLMQQQNVDILEFEESIETLTTNSVTPVFVARNQQILGIIGLADPIKADSKAAVHRFIRNGLLVVMLCGDNKNTAHAIATQVGITQVMAEVLPQHKAEQIDKLIRDGLNIAMVGHAVNDEPALTSAQVGFALGESRNITSEGIDVSLISGSLHAVADAVEISTTAFKKIQQNLYATFIYNFIGITLATGIFYPVLGFLFTPIYAAAVMVLFSFILVNNAYRVKWSKTVDE